LVGTRGAQGAVIGGGVNRPSQPISARRQRPPSPRRDIPPPYPRPFRGPSGHRRRPSSRTPASLRTDHDKQAP
jgi:hypothetical protein